jgi:thiamine biosynthesis lipoprotein
MGVQVRIVLYSPTQELAEQAARAAYRRIAELEDVMSDYRPTSELMRLCALSGANPVPVSRDLYVVLERAQTLASLSDGAFDVTVGPLVKLWRKARNLNQLPAREELEAAFELIGWEKIRLDSSAQTVELAVPGMQLDLGGIAKGYAGDEMMKVLREHGIGSALIELGGDFILGDPPPGREGWSVEIENADEEHRHAVLANTAISSSGDTFQYVEVDGVRYSHIVDPRTGMGLTNRIAVTVTAPNAFTSDGLSTTLSILGPEKGLELIEKHFPEAKAYIRYADEVAP